MDMEKTMQFILDQQAEVWAMIKAAEVRADRADKRMDRAEARMDRAEARMDRLEKSVDGIRKLVRTGMKLMVQIQQSQKMTDRKLQAFIDSLQKGGDGHRRR